MRNLGQGEDGLSGIRAPTAVSCSRSGRRIAVLDAGDMRLDNFKPLKGVKDDRGGWTEIVREL